MGGIPNYGWPYKVGDGNGSPPTNNWSPSDPCPDPGGNTYTPPAFAVYNTLGSFELWDALLGGIVYRGTAIDELKGKYVFCLNKESRIFYIDATSPLTDGFHELTADLGTHTAGPPFFAAQELHGLGQDAGGELYLIRVKDNQNCNHPGMSNGRIFRIIDQ